MMETNFIAKSWQVKPQLQVTDEPRTAVFVVSKEMLDVDDEVLLLDGINISKIEAGLYRTVWVGHDHSDEVAIMTGIQKINESLICSIKFPERPDDLPMSESWRPDLALAKTRAGFYNASIDALPVEARKPTKLDKETFGSTIKKVWSKSTMLGFSLTSWQSNPEAQPLLIKALKEKTLSADVLNQFEELNEQEKEEIISKSIETEQVVDEIKAEESVVEKVIEPVIEPVIEEKIENKVQKKVKPVIYVSVTSPDLVRKQIEAELKKQLVRIRGGLYIEP